jgi:hypothetical protein
MQCITKHIGVKQQSLTHSLKNHILIIWLLNKVKDSRRFKEDLLKQSTCHRTNQEAEDISEEYPININNSSHIILEIISCLKAEDLKITKLQS